MPCRDALVIGRPPSPATTETTSTELPASASRTSAVTGPMVPNESDRSSTTTRRAAASATRTARCGKGRKLVMPRLPTLLYCVAALVDDVGHRALHRPQ